VGFQPVPAAHPRERREVLWVDGAARFDADDLARRRTNALNTPHRANPPGSTARGGRLTFDRRRLLVGVLME
jgi:hypothetical protein